MTQYIVHVDMDAFFANVELMHNPDLKDKPFGVSIFDAKGRPIDFLQVGSLRGVLTTASYEARRFGVRSGMAGE